MSAEEEFGPRWTSELRRRPFRVRLRDVAIGFPEPLTQLLDCERELVSRQVQNPSDVIPGNAGHEEPVRVVLRTDIECTRRPRIVGAIDEQDPLARCQNPLLHQFHERPVEVLLDVEWRIVFGSVFTRIA